MFITAFLPAASVTERALAFLVLGDLDLAPRKPLIEDVERAALAGA
jgi:hypothetical protein